MKGLYLGLFKRGLNGAGDQLSFDAGGVDGGQGSLPAMSKPAYGNGSDDPGCDSERDVVNIRTRSTSLLAIAALAGMVVLAGCATDSSRFLDPSSVVKAGGSPVRPILKGLSGADYTPELLPNSSFPSDEDYSYKAEDYIIGPTDIIDVNLQDLFDVGVTTPLRVQVSTSGNISLPLLTSSIKVEGLTADQLRQAIIDRYARENIRQNMVVTVIVAGERQNTYSILGPVARPGPYTIIRKNMQLLEAIAQAGGIIQEKIPYIYVIRPAPAIRSGATTEPADGDPAPNRVKPEPDTLPDLPGASVAARNPQKQALEAYLRAGQVAAPALPTAAIRTNLPLPVPMMSDGAPARAAAGTPTSTDQAELNKAMKPTKTIFVRGQGFVEVPVDAPISDHPTPDQLDPVLRQPTTLPAGDPFGWEKASRTDQTRIIAIDRELLNQGEMNIVVRNNDVIMVPNLDIGEFYIMGEVMRPGVFSLTGRQLTVKMAIAAAGNLGPLAWPKNTILIRRIGRKQEQWYPIDVEAIFRGEQNDIFLKPDDVIAVGQSVWSPFIIVMRNAFRMTYGFGFIYDRNFAEPVLPGLNSDRFTRW